MFRVSTQGSVELAKALPADTGGGSTGDDTGGGPTEAEAPPLGIIVGAEYEGVGEAAAATADARVRIAMAPAMQVNMDL